MSNQCREAGHDFKHNSIHDLKGPSIYAIKFGDLVMMNNRSQISAQVNLSKAAQQGSHRDGT